MYIYNMYVHMGMFITSVFVYVDMVFIFVCTYLGIASIHILF